MFRDLAASTCKCMDGYRIAVFKKQRQCDAELSPRDFSFVELYWPSEAARMVSGITCPNPPLPPASPPGAAGFLLLIQCCERPER
jgi:hypothetical protein